MYYSHFGLTQPPFRITPNTEFFYSGGNRGPILEALIYAISQGEGIIKVTGEVGSGKTMLCNMLQSRLPPNVETAYIANPSVSPEEIVRAVALELHLKPPRDAGHLELMQMIHSHLLERHAQGRQVVMFVEESQSMPLATLEEMRLLSNLETAHNKLLQIVLFGQPELEDNLRNPQIRQLRERITHSFRLSPLATVEIGDYLNFRLRAAGYHGPDLFSRAVVRAIAKASGGLTRRINLIADKALLAAFAENTHSVKLKHIKAAVRDSEFSHYEDPRPPQRIRPAYGIALVLALVAAATLLYVDFAGRPEAQAPVSAPPLQPPPAAPSTPITPAPPAEQALTSAATPAPVVPEAEPPAAATVPVAATPPSAAPAPRTGPEKTETIINKQDVKSATRAAPVSSDVVEERLQATRSWLASAPGGTFTIQLFGADNQQQLKNHLNVIGKFVEINNVFVYRTIAKQKPSLTVSYGTFNDRRTAQEALAQLPAALKTYRPILRTVQGIRAELAQHQLP